MGSRLMVVWAALRDSLWFVPSLLTLLAIVAALTLVQIDAYFDLAFLNKGHWLIGGSVDGARAVLSTIAGSLITVTGVIFSVTIVALQLASSQFTPRILRNFMADRANQTVLGVFIATFTYTLLVLRVVRSTEENGDFVPQLSVMLAILLTMVSIGFLIFFIHHAARSVQASVILGNVTAEALAQVEHLFPDEIGEADPQESLSIPAGFGQVVAAETEGYLRAVDSRSLFSLGEDQQLVIQMVVPVGAFVLKGQTLARVWGEKRLSDGVRDRVRNAFLLGLQRSPGQDIHYYLLEISDMAVRALSPGINDPTTAIHCIDRLTQILLAFGRRRPPDPLRTASGIVHFRALPPTFEQGLEVAFSQIWHFGSDNPAVLRKLEEATAILEELLPAPRRTPLREFAEKKQLVQGGPPTDLA